MTTGGEVLTGCGGVRAQPTRAAAAMSSARGQTWRRVMAGAWEGSSGKNTESTALPTCSYRKLMEGSGAVMFMIRCGTRNCKGAKTHHARERIVRADTPLL